MSWRRTGSGVRYVASQLLGIALAGLALTLATFVLIRLTPGNSAAAIAVRRAGPGATAAQIELLTDQLGLRDPLIVQYGRWLGHAIRGDFGIVERSGLPVGHELANRLPKTLTLAAGGAVLALVAGTAAGIAAAVWRPRIGRGAVRALGVVGASVPAFWLSYLLILGFSEHLELLPTSGDSGIRSMVMPWIVLAVPAAGVISRVVAVTLRHALAQPFVTAARARGASRASTVWRDGLPHAAGASLNVVGIQLVGMLAGSVVVETVFGWPGLGRFFADAVELRDNDSIQAAVAVFAVGFVIVNRSVDAASRIIDPRLARDGRTR